MWYFSDSAWSRLKLDVKFKKTFSYIILLITIIFLKFNRYLLCLNIIIRDIIARYQCLYMFMSFHRWSFLWLQSRQLLWFLWKSFLLLHVLSIYMWFFICAKKVICFDKYLSLLSMSNSIFYQSEAAHNVLLLDLNF